jgi:hypothetical protein
MKERIFITVVLVAGFTGLAFPQIQNVNIGGSYSGTFLLSGSGTEDYQVSGSPYLSDTWMYGTLEMKGDVVAQARTDKEVRAKLHQYQVMIARIDALIAKLSDPEFQATGLSLTMEGADAGGEELEYDLRIANSDFSGMEEITQELGDKLLFHLEQLRGEYEAQINEFFKIKGLFRYNLYAQEFEMIYGRDTFAITAPFNVKSISISNMQFMHGLYVRRGGSRPHLGSAYFQVLSDGDCKLLMYHDVKIKSGEGPVTYSWASGGDTFVQYHMLYYQQAEGAEVIPIKNRKRSIRELFADRSKEIEKFIRSEKINLKDDAGLARVFDYYNNLDS